MLVPVVCARLVARARWWRGPVVDGGCGVRQAWPAAVGGVPLGWPPGDGGRPRGGGLRHGRHPWARPGPQSRQVQVSRIAFLSRFSAPARQDW